MRINLITAEFIENKQSRTLADVVSNDSSVHLVTAAGGGAETLVIRGFNAGGNSGSLYGGLPGLAHRRVTHVETLERVEVPKGSHALLSGMVGAVGGVTNLIPKSPTASPLTRLTTSFEGASKLGLVAGDYLGEQFRSDKLSAYQTVDLGARYKQNLAGKPLTLRIGIDNIFNENYWTIFSGSRVIYVGKPRTLSLSISTEL